MSFQGVDSSSEGELVQRCLAGETAALSELREKFLEPALNWIVSRGVESVLAREVVGTLWADCVVSEDGGPALLEKFRSKSGLRTWLARIALNRAFDRARSRQRISYLEPPARPGQTEKESLLLADMPAPTRVNEPDLVQLLSQSLEAGFDACPAEDLLKLRLIFLHGLTQRELARLWGCHETTVARDVRCSLHLIADQTLREVKRRDPWLTLSWEDFVGLCDAGPLGLG